MYPKITYSFNNLSVNTDTNGAENAAVICRCAVLLYDKTAKVGNTNGIRNELFKRNGKFAHENLPPTIHVTPQMRLSNREDWC